MKLVVVKVWVDTEDDNDAANAVSDILEIAFDNNRIKDYAIDSVEDAQ
jgi:phosphoribosylformylglycinamidine (FGAM) synthase PurS component